MASAGFAACMGGMLYFTMFLSSVGILTEVSSLLLMISASPETVLQVGPSRASSTLLFQW